VGEGASVACEEGGAQGLRQHSMVPNCGNPIGCLCLYMSHATSHTASGRSVVLLRLLKLCIITSYAEYEVHYLSTTAESTPVESLCKGKRYRGDSDLAVFFWR